MYVIVLKHTDSVLSLPTLLWAIPPVRLGLSGRNSGKTPERPRKRSQSVSWNFPREYGWDAPNPISQGILRFPERFQNSLPPSTAGDASFFRSGSGEGPLRAGHGIPSSTGGISEKGGFQKGGFGGCSPGTKTGTRARSPKPPFYETALLSPSDNFKGI